MSVIQHPSLTSQPSWSTLAVAPPRTRPNERVSVGMRDLFRYRRAVALVDGVVIAGALGVAMLHWPAILPLVNGGQFFPLRPEIAGIVAILWFAVLSAFRSRDVRILGAGSDEYRRVLGASLVVLGAAAIATVVFDLDLSRRLWTVCLPVGTVGLLIGRRVLRGWLARQRNQGRMALTALVVGPSWAVARVVTSIARGVRHYRVVGVVVDDDRKTLNVGDVQYSVAGAIDDVASAVESHSADVVIVAGQPNNRPTFMRDLGWSLERTEAELMVASQLANVAGPRIHLRPVDGLPLMHVELPTYRGGKHVAKRVLDMALSGLGLLVLSPLLLVVAALIKLDSSGPVFFSQDRVGRNGELFAIRKFRSMVTTAEADLAALQSQSEGNGVLFKMRADPRVTRIGAVLRKYSIDELPQLWNVLVGDMSLVGPRPPLGREVDSYERHVLRRLYIKPGLTGLWQVSGRSNLSWEDSVRLDLYYVENWSLLGDLRILWRTVKVVFRGDGAY